MSFRLSGGPRSGLESHHSLSNHDILRPSAFEHELSFFALLTGHYLAVLYLDFHDFSASLALDFALVVPVRVVAEMEDSSAILI